MAVRLRLKRTGTTNNPCYRVVVADQRAQRDGKAIEYIGFYDPKHDTEKIDLERVEYWLSQGAQPTKTVSAIINRAKSGKGRAAIVKREKKKRKDKKEENK